MVAWGWNGSGQTNVPTNLTCVVAIAAGMEHSLALQSNGVIVAWGDNSYGQCNVPTNASHSNVMAIAAGDYHSVALLNDGTLVAWGDNSTGQTNIPGELSTSVVLEYPNGTAPPTFVTNFNPSFPFKLIAAGGDHTVASIFSTLVQYPLDVSKDLLLIYNTNSSDSSNVCRYYTNNRPMVSNANVLGIGCTILETILPGDFTNIFMAQVTNWLNSNPTKRPSYVILFQDLPSRVNIATNPPAIGGGYEGTTTPQLPSVQYQLHNWCASNWYPFVTSINMNGSNSADPYNSDWNGQQNTNYPVNLFSSDGTIDCIAYINKLTNFGNMGGNVGKLIISGIAAGYGNTNWYFDDSIGADSLGYAASLAVYAVNPSASVVYSNSAVITNCTNVAGYFSYGIHDGGFFSNTYALNGQLIFSGNSGWYLITTDESFNGERYNYFQGIFLDWFSSGAFGGTNYSNTPVGAGSNVDEPGITSCNPPQFFGYWAAGKNFAICAWNSLIPNNSQYIQVVGDPFTKW